MGLYFNGEARDTCWGRGMFRGYVSGYVSGVCFGYVSRHQELLYLQLRGYVAGHVSGVCFGGMLRGMFRGCATRVPFLNLSPPKKHKPIYLSSPFFLTCFLVYRYRSLTLACTLWLLRNERLQTKLPHHIGQWHADLQTVSCRKALVQHTAHHCLDKKAPQLLWHCW